MLLPLMRFKTSSKREEINQNKNVYSINTMLDVSIYSKSNNDFCSVILKDLMFDNGFVETILLKYISNAESYDEILDLTDDFLNNYFN